jgi:tetratricopeptide (TPR) repeat protein
VVLLSAGGVAHAQEADPFAAGNAAFQQGDYAQALALFQNARAAGSDTPALEYNIGVCQYRVGDYAAAEATFGALASRFPSFHALAEYNRGLALLKLERREEAVAAFTNARSGGDERLAALATSALEELGIGAQQTARALWSGYFSAATGHDDNVALVDELSLPANVAAATPLTEVLGYARLTPTTRLPMHVDFSGYVVRYADATIFDQDSLRIDVAFSWSPGESWRLEAGPYFASSTLDGDTFERTLGAQLRATRSLSRRLAFDARFLYDDVEAPTTRFAFVAGNRERLRLTLERNEADRRLRVAYERESQDREAASVSPDRDRLMFGWARRLAGRWLADGTLSYRASRYDELTTPRKEQLVELAFTARRELRSGWLLNADYRFADNDSSISEFSYTSRRVTVGVSRTF